MTASQIINGLPARSRPFFGQPTVLDHLDSWVFSTATTLACPETLHFREEFDHVSVRTLTKEFDKIREAVALNRGICREDGILVKNGFYWLCRGFAAQRNLRPEEQPAEVCVGYSQHRVYDQVVAIELDSDGIPYLTERHPAAVLAARGGVDPEISSYLYFDFA